MKIFQYFGHKHLVEKDYNLKEVKKVMRLCALSMVNDGVINADELKCICEIVIRDYANGTVTDLRSFIAKYDSSKICITQNSEAKELVICSTDGWTMTVDISDNSTYAALSNNLKPNDRKNLAQYYAMARTFIEHVIHRLYSRDVQQGLFVNIDSLSVHDVLTELRDMILVIKADKIITEIERVAFVSVARIMRIVGSDSTWDDWMDYSKEKLLQLTSSVFFPKVRRRNIITANDAKTIEEAITSYKLRGPLCLGLQKAIRHNTNNFQNNSEKRYKLISWIALWAFVISGWLVYFGCATNIENKQIAHEAGIEMVSPIADSYAHVGLTTEQELNTDSLHLVGIEQLEFTDLASKSSYIRKGMLTVMDNGDTKFLNLIVWWILILVIICVVRVVQNVFLYHFNYRPGNGFAKYAQYLVMLLPLVTCIYVYQTTPEPVLSICYTPFFTLCMMISIEVMIFMRERYIAKNNESHKGSTKLLVVFVFAAVVADMCIGFLELPIGYEPWMLFDKIASAILLGCLSFFIGKFMDIDSMQKQAEIEAMNTSIENIEKFLSSSTEGESQTDVVTPSN